MAKLSTRKFGTGPRRLGAGPEPRGNQGSTCGKGRNWRGLVVSLAVVLPMALGSQARALTFHFTCLGAFTCNTGNPAYDGFVAAGQRWSDLFSDAITVNLNIGYSALDPGVLGQASSTKASGTYATFRTALLADAFGADDTVAAANLQASPALKIYLNRTSNNPHGSGSSTPYLDSDGDSNNTTIWANTANLKALGLWGANDSGMDAQIIFSTSFTWDFNPSDGVANNAFDFIGVATHEIGHALGFVSGVDILGYNSPPQGGPYPDDAFTFVTPLDTFRFSTDSFAQGALDWTADTREKYFSINGGATNLATFSTGTYFGDGQQASHWKDNRGIGIMDPTAGYGERLAISTLDVQALDVIGYNRIGISSQSQPVPGPLPLLGATAGFGWSRRLRRRLRARHR